MKPARWSDCTRSVKVERVALDKMPPPLSYVRAIAIDVAEIIAEHLETIRKIQGKWKRQMKSAK